MTPATPYTPAAARAAFDEAADARLTVAALHRRCVPDGYRCVALTAMSGELTTLWTPDDPALPMVTVRQDADGMTGPGMYAREAGRA